MKWFYGHPGRDDVLKNIIYSENPLLALFKPSDDWKGKYLPVPIPYKEKK